MAPVLARIASTSVVLPAWCGPTKAIFRRRSTFAIGGSSCAVLTLAAFRRRAFFHGVRRRLARFLGGGFLDRLFCGASHRRFSGGLGRRFLASGRRGFRLLRRFHGLRSFGFLGSLPRGRRL